MLLFLHPIFILSIDRLGISADDIEFIGKVLVRVVYQDLEEPRHQDQHRRKNYEGNAHCSLVLYFLVVSQQRLRKVVLNPKDEKSVDQVQGVRDAPEELEKWGV